METKNCKIFTTFFKKLNFLTVMKEELIKIYDRLFNHYGSQNWWPGEGLEIAIGAVLTQQTSWKNVERALTKLREAGCIDLQCLDSIPLEKLELLIRPSGFYKVKAKRLKNLISLLIENPTPSRESLLSVNGLGFETVDSILLYWFEKPYFVVDSYTFRIFERLGFFKKSTYLQLQRVFMDNLPTDVQLYKEYHALIVQHAKEYCLKKQPKCVVCPLADLCEYNLKKKKITKM